MERVDIVVVARFNDGEIICELAYSWPEAIRYARHLMALTSKIEFRC